jgi:hypothetical protein
VSKWEPSRAKAAAEAFAKQVHLARFVVQEKTEDFWRTFDLADTLLFSGKSAEAFEEFDKAVALVRPEARRNVFSSVLGPLQNFITAEVLSGQLAEDVKTVIEKLQAASKAASS